MKKSGIFILSVVAMLIGCFVLPVSAAEEKKDLKSRLDDEFKWLREEAMVITVATKTKMNIDDAPSIVSVITEEQIKSSGAKDLEEVLRQVAGFNLYKPSVYPDINVGIRGLSDRGSPSVKIMVNGHSMEGPVERNIDNVISVPIALIKKIEIIRGPGSALYGNSAMNGVINIITKDAKSPSEVSAGYGSFDTYTGTGQLSYSKNDFSMFLFADHITSDGDPQLIGKDAASLRFPPGFSRAPGYSNEEFRSSTFYSKISYKNVWLTGYLTDDKREPSVGIQNALTDENNVIHKTAFVEAGYDGALTEKIKLSAKAYYDYKLQDLSWELFDGKTSAFTKAFSGFPKDQGMFAMPGSKFGKIGTELLTDIRMSDSLEMLVGASFESLKTYDVKILSNANVIGRPMILNGTTYMPMQYLGGLQDTSADYNYMDDADRKVYAGYVQGTWNMTEAFPALKQIGKNLSLTAGLRYDDYNDVGNTLKPRLGIVYAPNDRLFFKLLYGEAFRAPVFSEMYYKNSPAAVGNPNLQPETIETAEILAGINLTEGITATVDFFNIRKKNTIRLYQNAFENWGHIESQGVEGEIRASFDKHKYGYFNVTFQKAKDVSNERISDVGGTAYIQDDFDLGAYPKVVANLGLNSDISRYVNANVSISYVGSMDRIGKMQFTASKTDPDGTIEKADQRDATGSYTLTNISLIFHNFNFAKGWEFQITGYNIFNSDQRDPEPEGAVPNDLPRWGRNFMGKITYTF